MLIRNIVALAIASFILALSGSTFASAENEAAELASIAAVEGASIKILSPADGTHIKAGAEATLAYEVKPGKGGEHFHVWVGEKRGPSIRETKGAYTLPRLTSGKYVISIRIVDKDHVATGPRRSINLIVDSK